MKKMLFIFLCAFLFLVTLTSLLIFPTKKNQDLKQDKAIVIWHVDGFEGGIGSRLNCLKKIAVEYMKKTKTVVSVNLQTVNSSEENFKKGIFPDIISYSNGLELPYDRLLSISNEKDYEYAKPWCAGGYLIISRKNEQCESLVVSQQEYTLPLLAMHLNEIKTPIKCIISSDKAIYEFYSDKKCALLGTQRDLFRLQNKGIECEVNAISAFNDLYQYVSVTAKRENYKNCIDFLNFLFSKCKQKDVLEKIGLLPDTGYSANLCDKILEPYAGISYEYTTYTLINKGTLRKLQEEALNYQKEEESIKNALKRLK